MTSSPSFPPGDSADSVSLPTSKPPQVGFVSLGCPKATVDSERILSQLRAQGYAIATDYQEAELVIVNTCGFIDAAVEESLDAIGEAINETGRVIVTGCLGARADVIRDAHPSVLAVTGPQAVDEVMELVHGEITPPHDPFVDLVPPGGVKLTPRHYAYLKISEGCNHHCTFCIIPSMRGRLVSRPVADVLSEAQALTGAGVRELLVISQDTSAYGVDLRYKPGFFGQRPVKSSMLGLAQALSAAPFDPDLWIRLHYVYPYPHVDDVIPLMAEGRVLPYLDVPFQHADPAVLKRMRRPAHGEHNLDRINQWRQVCPELVIRSTFIVGFPGETETEFEALLAFIAQAELDRVGCFTYSPVEGAAANALADPVPIDLAEERRERLMELQADISAGKLYQREGQVLRCLVDEVRDDEVIARSYADAPEIDGVVHVQLHDNDDDESQPLPPNFTAPQVGEFIDVEIIGATEHDLFARPYVDD